MEISMGHPPTLEIEVNCRGCSQSDPHLEKNTQNTRGNVLLLPLATHVVRCMVMHVLVLHTCFA